MVAQVQPTLLTIGLEGLPPSNKAMSVYAAASTREALATMRLIGFDLVVAGLENPQLDVWETMHRVLTAWPRQRWMLASSRVTPEEEILARSLGAVMVLDETPDETWLADFASSLQRRELTPPISPFASIAASPLALQGDWRGIEAQ